MSRFALFLGCTVPIRARNYEMSARAVCTRLGIDLEDIPGFSCCGFPVKSTDARFSQVLSVRNLALAEKAGLNICVLCSACTAMLAEANHLCRENPEHLREMNEYLKQTGLEYHGGVEVKHFCRVMMEDAGLEAIQAQVKIELKSLKIAPHYGCHYLKPTRVHGGLDSAEHPSSVSELITAAGAECVELAGRKDCCGGALLVVDKSVTYRMAAKKLDRVKDIAADALALICPFCAVIYDDNQRAIEAELGIQYDLPVIYYPQLLGLAMGIDSKALGLNLNKIKTKVLLEKLREVQSNAG